jgi:hypothetical protein
MTFDAAAFLQQYLDQEPARRAAAPKKKGGRSAPRVREFTGGRVSAVAAIYDGPDGSSGYRPMCQVVGRAIKAVSDPRAAPVSYNPTGPYSYVGRVGCV